MGVSGENVHHFGGLISASLSAGTLFIPESNLEQSAKDHYSKKNPT